MDDQVMLADPVRVAIYRALSACDALLLALTEAENKEALDGEQSRQAHSLRSKAESGLLIVTCDITAVRDLATSLDDSIRRATSTYFVHDECDMSGGHEEEVVTNNGFTLIALRARLNDVALNLGEVKNLLRAEELAAELRL